MGVSAYEFLDIQARMRSNHHHRNEATMDESAAAEQEVQGLELVSVIGFGGITKQV